MKYFHFSRKAPAHFIYESYGQQIRLTLTAIEPTDK